MDESKVFDVFQNGELVFADECPKDLMAVLQRWFQLDAVAHGARDV